MTKATDLSAAMAAALSAIIPANGYATDLKGVYGFGETKKDAAPLPCLLVRIVEDSAVSGSGRACKRLAQYEIEAVFSRSATLQDLQLCHHDILRAVIYSDLLPTLVPLANNVTEGAAEFDPDRDGSTLRVMTCTLGLHYIENY